MIRFLVRRLLVMAATLWLVYTVVFVVAHATPGSPWDRGTRPLDEQALINMNEKFGFRAEGLAADDAVGSLAVNQPSLGTKEVVVIERADCGLLTFHDDTVRAATTDRTGVDAALPLRAFR